MNFTLWGGLFLFFGAILLSRNIFNNIKVELDGTVVQMKIEDLPGSCIGSRSLHYVSLRYGGRKFIKEIPSSYCADHHIGENVDMKFLEGSSVVLLPNESAKTEFYILIILGLIGLAMFVTQFIKLKKIQK